MRKGGLRWVPAAFVCGICAVMYPIFIHPYFFPEKWQDVQRITRSGIDQDKIQPAASRVYIASYSVFGLWNRQSLKKRKLLYQSHNVSTEVSYMKKPPAQDIS